MDREEFRQEAILRVFSNLATGYILSQPNYKGWTIDQLISRTVFVADRLTYDVIGHKMEAPQD